MRLQILKVPNSKLVGKVSIRELLRLKFPNNNRVGKTSIGKLHWLKNPIKQTGGEGVKKRTATDEDVRSKNRKEEEDGLGTSTVFVENIPNSMLWKGLWHAFARNGDVVDAYIAKKLSERRRRFGFVRFKSKTNATRAIEQLNGFSLYGSRLLVKMAEFERKNGEGVDNNSARMCNKYHKDFNNHELGGDFTNHELGGGTRMNYNNEGGSNERRNKKRIIGHIEEEDLWNLRSCQFVTTATVCSVSSIESRLAEIWGSFQALGENGNHFHNCRVDVQVVPDIENLILEEEEDDALNAILMSKDGSAGCNLGNETESFLGEMELVGKANVASQKLISVQAITNQGELEGLDQVKSLIQMLDNVKSSWADVLKEVLDYSRGSKDSEPVKGLGVIESRAAGPGRAKTNLIHSSGPCLRSVGPSLNERPLDRIEVLNQMSKGS
ncbi:hypothetical protein V6N13_056872 [Hibiscus sabdariffa]